MANTRVYVLDPHLQPVPLGVPGELYLGGVQLATGYLNRPELTAARFIADPFSDGGRLYRTGDRVRLHADGNLDYLGRTDDQLKWRGFRIEPGEIEAVLTDLPNVAQAAVLLREDHPGDPRLVAYLVAAPTAPDIDAVRTALKQRLPDYMVPAAFVILDALPLTPSGKVARRLLPAPDWAAEAQAYVAPRNPVEEVLVQLFADVLGLEQVGVHDDFFRLGGHSLLATQLISRIRDALEVEVPLLSLFEHPTVAEFSRKLDPDSVARAQTPIEPCDRQQSIPLSFAQQRLWFLDQLEPDSPAYNFPVALKLDGDLDKPALKKAIDTLVLRHEGLRTTFPESNGEPVQSIAPDLTIKLEEIDLVNESADTLHALLTDRSRQPFDLADGPLLRTSLIQLSENKHVLLLATHHIVSDGWSLQVLMHELATLYNGFRRPGSVPELAQLPVQYADFAAWQRSWFSGPELQRQLDFWRGQLSSAPTVLNLPTDWPRPNEQTYHGAGEIRWQSRELMDRLKTIARDQGCTLYMVLLAAFDALLSRYAGEDDIVVGTPIAGRNRTELEGLIGFFVNTLALRNDLSGDPTFAALLDRVRKTAVDAYAHQELPFEKLVEELQPERATSH